MDEVLTEKNERRKRTKVKGERTKHELSSKSKRGKIPELVRVTTTLLLNSPGQ